MTQAMNVLALESEGHRYIFLYDDHSTETALETVMAYAADPEHALTWYDAAVLAQRLQRLKVSATDCFDVSNLSDDWAGPDFS